VGFDDYLLLWLHHFMLEVPFGALTKLCNHDIAVAKQIDVEVDVMDRLLPLVDVLYHVFLGHSHLEICKSEVHSLERTEESQTLGPLSYSFR